MERVEVEHNISLSRFHDVKAGIVKWPMSVIRLSCFQKENLIDAADYILTKWRSYPDPSAGIYAYTNNTPHNSITPIARKRDGRYELDIALRNNITTPEHPLGVFTRTVNCTISKKKISGL